MHPVETTPVGDAEWANYGVIEDRPRRPKDTLALRQTTIELFEVPIQPSRNVREGPALRHNHRGGGPARGEVSKRDDQRSDRGLAKRSPPFGRVSLAQAPLEARGVPRVGQIQVFEDVGDRPLSVGRDLRIGRGDSCQRMAQTLAARFEIAVHPAILVRIAGR